MDLRNIDLQPTDHPSNDCQYSRGGGSFKGHSTGARGRSSVRALGNILEGGCLRPPADAPVRPVSVTPTVFVVGVGLCSQGVWPRRSVGRGDRSGRPLETCVLLHGGHGHLPFFEYPPSHRSASGDRHRRTQDVGMLWIVSAVKERGTGAGEGGSVANQRLIPPFYISEA